MVATSSGQNHGFLKHASAFKFRLLASAPVGHRPQNLVFIRALRDPKDILTSVGTISFKVFDLGPFEDHIGAVMRNSHLAVP